VTTNYDPRREERFPAISQILSTQRPWSTKGYLAPNRAWLSIASIWNHDIEIGNKMGGHIRSRKCHRVPIAFPWERALSRPQFLFIPQEGRKIAYLAYRGLGRLYQDLSDSGVGDLRFLRSSHQSNIQVWAKPKVADVTQYSTIP
jgi:hypothetical protein